MEAKAVLEILPTALPLIDYVALITGTAVDHLSSLLNAGESCLIVADLKNLLRDVQVFPETTPPNNLPLMGSIRGSGSSDAIGRGAMDSNALKMRNLINRFITQHIRTNRNFKERNCLALGYRARSGYWNNAGMRNSTDIECEFVNTIHGMLTTAPWQKLANFLGEEILLHLLSRPMFAPGSNGCYLQISGIPINELLYKANAQSASGTVSSRTFFLKRKELIANMKVSLDRHHPPPNAGDTEMWQVEGRTQLPHFDMFYKHSYHKMNRLSVSKITTTGASIMAEIFGNVIATNVIGSNKDSMNIVSDENQGASVRILEDKSRHGMLLCASLETMILRVVNNYRCCDVSKAMSDHCAGRADGGRTKRTRVDDIPDTFNESGSKKETNKTKRGCRAGKAQKKKNERKQFLETKLPKVPEVPTGDISGEPPVDGKAPSASFVAKTNHSKGADGADGSGSVSGSAANIPSRAAVTSLSSSSPKKANKIASVGQRLFNRIQKNVRKSIAYNEDGYVSQEDNAAGITALAPTPPMSQDSSQSLHQSSLEKVEGDFEDQEVTKCHGNIENIGQSARAPQLGAPPDATSMGGLKRKRQVFGPPSPPVEDDQGQGQDVSADEGYPFEKAPLSMPTQSTTSSGVVHHLGRVFSTQLSSSASVNEEPGFSSKRYREATKTTSMTASTPSFALSKVLPAQNQTKQPLKPNFFEASIPLASVKNFIKSVCRRTFTIDDVWGSRHNMNAFLSNVDWYFCLGRNETLTVAQMAAKINVGDLKWLAPSNSEKNTNRLLHAFIYWVVSDFINPLVASYFYVTEGEGRGSEALFYRRSVWNEIISKGFKQVGSHFMNVMDISDGGTQRIIGNPANARFMPKKNSLRLITNLRTKKMSGLQPYQQQHADGVTVSNNALYNCLHVLHHIYTRNSILAGFGSLGIDEIHAKLVRFLQRTPSGTNADAIRTSSTTAFPVPRLSSSSSSSSSLSSSSSSSSFQASSSVSSSGTVTSPGDDLKYYVAVLDLEKCYDNVDTVQLFNLIRDLLDNKLQDDKGLSNINLGEVSDKKPPKNNYAGGANEAVYDEYALHKYFVSHRLTSVDRSVSKSIRHLSQGDDMLTFREASEKISGHYNNSILSDGVIVPKLPKAEILRLLHLHLFNHVVKMPVYNKNKERNGKANGKHDLFTQIKGIPQGSIISPLLCNLYYGNAERRVFGSAEEVQLLGLEDRSVIIRIMDDYIMISRDREAVQHFLQRAHQSLKPFGGGVNPTKTRVNFPSSIELEGQRVELTQIAGKFMPWCGYLLDTETLEVRPNIERLVSRHIRFSVTTECASPAPALRRALKSFVRMKCHALIIDQAINSFATVYRNIYEIYLLAAMRMHAYIAAMRNFSVEKNLQYLTESIIEAIFFGARLARTALRRSSRRRLVMERPSDHFDDDEDTVDSDTGEDSDYEDNGRRSDNHQAVYIDSRGGGCGCPVSDAQMEWLGYVAFSAVMNLRNGKYAKVKSLLRRKKDSLEAILRKQGVYHSRDPLLECDAILTTAEWM